jgi:hypothetical protein
LFKHRGHVEPRETDTRENVDVEEAKPVFVGDLVEGFGFEDAEVVDEDIDGGERVVKFIGGSGGRKIAGEELEFGGGILFEDFVARRSRTRRFGR